MQTDYVTDKAVTRNRFYPDDILCCYKMIYLMKGYLPLTMIFWASIMSACQNYAEPAEIPAMASFKLVNGSTISDATYDDYNPVVQQLSNGTLALVFASTRTCSSGCAGNSHNVYIASSSGTYNNDGTLPAFNSPQVVTANALSLNFSTRIRLAVYTSGNNINVFIQNSGGQISNTGYVSPISTVPINIGASLPLIGAYNCASLSMLGLDGAGLMIATAGASGPISRFDSTNAVLSCISTPVNPLPSAGMASASNISIMRSSDIGIPEGFLVTQSGGKLSAQSSTSTGPQIKSFTDALTSQGLTLTNASVFNANQSSGDLLVFSASSTPGGPSDMYAVTNKTPAVMWLKYTKFGAQPTP